MGAFFSVVIPTYNRRFRAACAARSVLAQTEGDFECLVVDDGSSDGTTERFKAFTDPRLRLIQNPKNRGQHFCRNLAIRQAQGRWIVFLDSDDLYLPERLKILRQDIEANPSREFWLSNAYIERDGRITGLLFDPKRNIPQGHVPGYYAVGDDYLPYVTSVLAIRREVFERVGYFREDMRILEDTELYARMLDAGTEVGAVKEPLAVRFLHEGQITHDHALEFEESVEALRSARTPAAIFESARRRLAIQKSEHLLKALQTRQAREFLLRKLGPSARSSFLYLETFVPRPFLWAAKSARGFYLKLRHAPIWANNRVREASRFVHDILEAETSVSGT